MTDFEIPDVHYDGPAYRPAPSYEPPGEPVGRRGPVRFERVSTTALMAMQFEEIRWIVPGYVPEGFSVLAGRQKLGKTWLAIDWAASVACGGFAMGQIDVEAGDVLYIDCENGRRRAQRRINQLFPDDGTRPDLSRLEWVTGAPALDKGLLDGLDDWRKSVRNPRLVVIDVLQRIKPPGNSARTSYENDYSIWSPLQQWATEHGIAVVGLHHTKKGGADDPLEALSGSNGLSACADTTLVLDRTSEGITLYVRGRDVDEKETALSFDAGRWSIRGEASEVRKSVERHLILKALAEADAPMNPRELSVAANMARNGVDQLLFKMAKAGEVLKTGRGLYVHSERRDLLIEPKAPIGDKNDKKVRRAADTEGATVIPIKKQQVSDVSEALPQPDIAAASYVLTDLIVPQADKKLVEAANEPAPAPVVTDDMVREFEAHAAAINCTDGDGEGRRLTPEGEQLIDHMIRKGVRPRAIARMCGIARQSVEYRIKRMKAPDNG